MPKSASSEKTKSVKRAPTPTAKRHSLSTCSLNGAGWCAYPFTAAQLERRLKEKAARAQAEGTDSQK